MKFQSLHNYSISKIGGEMVLVPIVDSIAKMDSLLVINETGAFIVEKMEAGLSLSEIVDSIIHTYNNDDRAQVEKETLAFAEGLCKRGFFNKV